MNECNREIFTHKKLQSGEKILTIVCLSKEQLLERRNMTVQEFSAEMRRYVRFPSTPFISCSTWRRCLPGESGCSQACLSVRLTVVQLNLKPEAPLSALLPTNNEIERDSWEDVSTIELRGVLSTAEIENIHFSGWKPTNWNVTSSCTSYAIFKTARRYFLSSFII